MSRLRCNTGAGKLLARWIAMGWPVAVSFLLSFASNAQAQSEGVPPRGPTAGSVPTAPSPPKAPADPRGPAAASNGNSDRMLDLAKRLASGEPATTETPFKEPHDAGTGVAMPGDGEAERRAAASNQMKLADPDEKKPLSGRVKHGEGTLPDSSPQSVNSGSWLLSGFTALGVVLILILLLRGALRKAGIGGTLGTHPAVQVISRVPVAPRNHVLLIRVGQRVLVVGDSVAGLRTLASIDEPEEVAEIITSAASAKPESIAGGFRKMLQGFSGMYGGGEQEVGGDESEFQVDRARDGVAGLVGRLRGDGGGGGDA